MEINGPLRLLCDGRCSKKRAAGGFHSAAFISGVFCSNNFTHTQKKRERERERERVIGMRGNEKDDFMNTEEVDKERRRRGRVNAWVRCGKKSAELEYPEEGDQIS